MKNPADMRYMEKKVCAMKHDIVKVGEAGGEHGQGAATVHHQVIQREHPEKHPHVQREADQEVDRDGIRHHEKRV